MEDLYHPYYKIKVLTIGQDFLISQRYKLFSAVFLFCYF